MTQLRETAKRIRALLEEVYDTTLVLDFRELCEKYVSCFDEEISMLFYIKERKWFVDSIPQKDPFLKFNYLSFESRGGQLDFFTSPRALEQREQEMEAAGFVRDISRRCVILLNPEELSGDDFTPVKNLTRRLFVAFYRNCGSFDHFRDSVSLRFAREMHKSVDEVTEENVAGFIRDRLSLNLEIFHQKDELYFTPDAKFQDLIKDSQTASRLPLALTSDPEFNRAFKASILRKNKTYGKCGNSDYRFAIVTHAEEYFVNNEMIGHRTIKQRPKICMVCFSDSQHLDLEEVHHATRIISLFLHYSEVHDRESLMSFYSSRVLELEERLSENPEEGRSDIDEIVTAALLDIFEFALRVSDAEGFVLYEYDPVFGGLQPKIKNSLADAAEVPSIELMEPHNRVFETGTSLDIWHPDKLEHDILEARERGTPEQIEKAEISEKWLRDSNAISALGDIGPRAAWITPIIRGRTPVGVVEFYSSSASRLSPSIPVLRAASELAGEIMHRSELANDRGWLARLSFIQVARHRIENAIEKVYRIDPKLAEQLKSSFIDDSSEEENLPQRDLSSSDVIEVTKRFVGDRGLRVELSEEFWRKFYLLKKYEPLSPSVASAIADVLETMLSNESHSPFQADRLRVQLVSEESGYPFLEINYAPNNVNVPIDRAQRLCTAPFRRKRSPTYHYGLFLCGTQLRMIGGRAFASVAPIDGSRSSRFILNFQVPLRIWSENNGGGS